MWVKLDDKLWTDPQMQSLTDGAVALWTRAASYVGYHNSDGFVPESALKLFCTRKRYVAELVDKGVWERVEAAVWPLTGGSLAAGWRFIGWEDSGLFMSRERVLAKRIQENQRQTRRRHGVTPPVTHGVTHGVTHAAPDPVPVLTPILPSQREGTPRAKRAARDPLVETIKTQWVDAWTQRHGVQPQPPAAKPTRSFAAWARREAERQGADATELAAGVIDTFLASNDRWLVEHKWPFAAVAKSPERYATPARSAQSAPIAWTPDMEKP